MFVRIGTRVNPTKRFVYLAMCGLGLVGITITAPHHFVMVKVVHMKQQVWKDSMEVNDGTSSADSHRMLVEQVIDISDDHEPRSKTAIFYNAFIPPGNPGRSVSIISEQLEQLINATHHREATLYYNIIGHDHQHPICPDSLKCEKLAYYPEGYEDLTLQAVYEHCTAHEDDYVIYMHDKGSFHAKHSNDRLRRLGTKAAVSVACQGITTNATAACNVCSFKFQTFPFAHVPGNFWSAKCSYIRKLAPPREYEQTRRNLCHFITAVYGTNEMCPPEVTNETLISVTHGLGRHAMERWIPSHSEFSPCTVMDEKVTPLRDFTTGLENWTPTLARSLKTSRRVTPDQRTMLGLLVHEYAYVHGVENATKFCQRYFMKGNPCPRLDAKFVHALANRSAIERLWAQ